MFDFEGAEYLEDWSTEEILSWAWRNFGSYAQVGTSFQGAGLVMLHISARLGFRFPVFTIDTGFLFPETLELKKRLEDFLSVEIESLYPDYSPEEQETVFGKKLWEHEPDFCCSLRKVVPLQSRLKQVKCWITGLRREQSDTRSSISMLEVYEVDPGVDIAKLSPMANWSREAVWDYIRQHKIPYNPLHDAGYRSIGCWPCTSKTPTGGVERAGRWTGFKKSECGIHTFMERKQ